MHLCVHLSCHLSFSHYTHCVSDQARTRLAHTHTHTPRRTRCSRRLFPRRGLCISFGRPFRERQWCSARSIAAMKCVQCDFCENRISCVLHAWPTIECNFSGFAHETLCHQTNKHTHTHHSYAEAKKRERRLIENSHAADINRSEWTEKKRIARPIETCLMLERSHEVRKNNGINYCRHSRAQSAYFYLLLSKVRRSNEK